MLKSRLRVLTLSLSVLFGAVLGARTAKAQEANQNPVNSAPKLELTLSVQLSSRRFYPLEPVGVVVTLTNNRNGESVFAGWDFVKMQIRRVGSPDWQSFRFLSNYPTTSSSLSLRLWEHESVSSYGVLSRNWPISRVFDTPGQYEIRLQCSSSGDRQIETPPFAFEVSALTPAEELAASYLEAHDLAKEFSVDRDVRLAVVRQKNPDGTRRFGEAERAIQFQLQAFLLQFPDSLYVPWVRLAQLSVASRYIKDEARILKNIREQLALSTVQSDVSAEEWAKVVADYRGRVEASYGPQLTATVLAGKPTPLHEAHELNAINAQLEALAPLLPSPINSRAWVLAAQNTQFLQGQDPQQDAQQKQHLHDNFIHDLDEAEATQSKATNTEATKSETNLSQDIALRRYPLHSTRLFHAACFPFEWSRF